MYTHVCKHVFEGASSWVCIPFPVGLSRARLCQFLLLLCLQLHFCASFFILEYKYAQVSPIFKKRNIFLVLHLSLVMAQFLSFPLKLTSSKNDPQFSPLCSLVSLLLPWNCCLRLLMNPSLPNLPVLSRPHESFPCVIWPPHCLECHWPLPFWNSLLPWLPWCSSSAFSSPYQTTLFSLLPASLLNGAIWPGSSLLISQCPILASPLVSWLHLEPLDWGHTNLLPGLKWLHLDISQTIPVYSPNSWATYSPTRWLLLPIPMPAYEMAISPLELPRTLWISQASFWPLFSISQHDLWIQLQKSLWW